MSPRALCLVLAIASIIPMIGIVRLYAHGVEQHRQACLFDAARHGCPSLLRLTP